MCVTVKTAVVSAALCIMMSGCNGIMSGIYDDPADGNGQQYGFISFDQQTSSGQIYIDATSYTSWHYIDFSSRTVADIEISDDRNEPEEWDFAIHRYDARTNGGSVLETGCSEFSQLVPENLESGEYVSDEWTTEQIITDMSGMMDGVILYQESFYNPVLSRWLDVDKSTMPPVYTMSGRIYILALPDGSKAALKLTGFMNGNAVKGYMTIDYIYPLVL